MPECGSVRRGGNEDEDGDGDGGCNVGASPSLRFARLGTSGGRTAAHGGVACLLLIHPGTMKDVVLVLATVGFFAVAWAYTRALDRL